MSDQFENREISEQNLEKVAGGFVLPNLYCCPKCGAVKELQHDFSGTCVCDCGETMVSVRDIPVEPHRG